MVGCRANSACVGDQAGERLAARRGDRASPVVVGSVGPQAEPGSIASSSSPGCRNWQTRSAQNRLSERACGFESRSRHHTKSALTKVASRSYLKCMRAVGLKTLKNKLSEYVRLAAGGETILISDRDRIVAELVPPRQSRGENVSDALLADALRNGLLSPPLDPRSPVPNPPGVAPLQEILDSLKSDRSDD